MKPKASRNVLQTVTKSTTLNKTIRSSAIKGTVKENSNEKLDESSQEQCHIRSQSQIGGDLEISQSVILSNLENRISELEKIIYEKQNKTDYDGTLLNESTQNTIEIFTSNNNNKGYLLKFVDGRLVIFNKTEIEGINYLREGSIDFNRGLKLNDTEAFVDNELNQSSLQTETSQEFSSKKEIQGNVNNNNNNNFYPNKRQDIEFLITNHDLEIRLNNQKKLIEENFNSEIINLKEKYDSSICTQNSLQEKISNTELNINLITEKQKIFENNISELRNLIDENSRKSNISEKYFEKIIENIMTNISALAVENKDHKREFTNNINQLNSKFEEFKLFSEGSKDELSCLISKINKEVEAFNQTSQIYNQEIAGIKLNSNKQVEEISNITIQLSDSIESIKELREIAERNISSINNITSNISFISTKNNNSFFCDQLERTNEVSLVLSCEFQPYTSIQNNLNKEYLEIYNIIKEHILKLENNIEDQRQGIIMLSTEIKEISNKFDLNIYSIWDSIAMMNN